LSNKQICANIYSAKKQREGFIMPALAPLKEVVDIIKETGGEELKY